MDDLLKLKLELHALKITIKMYECVYEQIKEELRKSGNLETDYDNCLNFSIGPEDTEEFIEHKINAIKTLSKIHELKNRFVSTYQKLQNS